MIFDFKNEYRDKPNKFYLTLYIISNCGDREIPRNVEGGADVKLTISEEALEELLTPETYRVFYQDLVKKFDISIVRNVDYHFDVYSVTGSLQAVEKTFMQYIRETFADEVGGDDDTFDYFPDAISKLMQIASDLDMWKNDSTSSQLLRDSYMEYISVYGRVMEFQYDEQDISGNDDE